MIAARLEGVTSTAKPRTPYVVKSKTLSKNPACAPLRDMLTEAHEQEPKSWLNVEGPFLRAMEEFDSFVADGTADQGARRNGKGEFFNDLLAMVLSNCSGLDLVSRPGVPGLIFPKHNLDITYPGGKDVVIEFLLEAKTIGTPKHPGNESQANPLGRPGKSDLPKRVKEAGFKTIDLKAEYGRLMAAHGHSPSGGPSGDVTSWLRAQKPLSYLFVAARLVDSGNDLKQVVQLCNQAALVMDVVGLYCFMPVSPGTPTRYERVDVPNHLAIDRVLHRTCLDLQGLAGKAPTPLPGVPALADAAVDAEVGGEDDADSEDDG